MKRGTAAQTVTSARGQTRRLGIGKRANHPSHVARDSSTPLDGRSKNSLGRTECATRSNFRGSGGRPPEDTSPAGPQPGKTSSPPETKTAAEMLAAVYVAMGGTLLRIGSVAR